VAEKGITSRGKAEAKERIKTSGKAPRQSARRQPLALFLLYGPATPFHKHPFHRAREAIDSEQSVWAISATKAIDISHKKIYSFLNSGAIHSFGKLSPELYPF